MPTIVASVGLSGALFAWSVLLALHPTDWSSPKAAVLAGLAGLAAAGAHRHAAAPVLAASGMILLARPFVDPIQYVHLGARHDLDLTSQTHHGMLTRGGLLLALAVGTAGLLLRGESDLRPHLRWPVVGVVLWGLYPLGGDRIPQHGAVRWYGDRWITAWTAIAAVMTVVILIAVVVDEIRAHRRERERARASASLFGLP